jgi:coenzyme F420 biosynthesis associated uncharacterized protein
MTASEMIDWELAISVGSRLAGPGPEVGRAEADAVVAELREDAGRSTSLVREYTGLVAAERTAPLYVVDRPGWIRANTESFDVLHSPMVAKMTEKKGPPTGVSKAVGSRVTGAEVGAVLGFLGGKVLGQFDPFRDPDGRLLLVAPNIVHVERELGANPTDFRLWVCLHEETHRVQFTAVPWLRDHMVERVRTLATDLVPDPESLQETFSRLSHQLPDAFRSGGAGLTDLITTPEQRAELAKVTAVMSLLEGHADVVMDEVGPQVIPSVAQIRDKFNQRRKGVGAFDRMLRRLLGLEAKMRQYRDGAVFVREVTDTVGVDGFNRVWDSPENLPLPAEIEKPASWVARVHG